MKQRIILAVSFVFVGLLIEEQGHALSEAPFRFMTCDRLLMDQVQVQTSLDELQFTWRVRGSSRVFPLLRRAAPQAIPDHLLRAYNFVDVKAVVPLSNCQFDEERMELFECRAQSLTPVSITAAIGGAYRGDSRATYDMYELELDALAISTFSASRMLGFDVHYFDSIDDTDVNLNPTPFFAEYGSADGFRQDPDCLVDNRFVRF